MPAQSRMIFVNLPVADVAATKQYFGTLGFEFDDKFSDEHCVCMVINDQAFAMLMDKSRFADFAPTQLADPHVTTQALFALSADSREAVDAFADKALANGGTHARDATDYGFMYGRSFHDLDGHVWEIMWMDPKAVEMGPEEFAAAQNA